MSTPIRRYKEEDRPAVIARRLKGNTKGLGYLSAKAAQRPRKTKG